MLQTHIIYNRQQNPIATLNTVTLQFLICTGQELRKTGLSTLRGILGYSLKDISCRRMLTECLGCIKRYDGCRFTACSDCSFTESCAFFDCFSPSLIKPYRFLELTQNKKQISFTLQIFQNSGLVEPILEAFTYASGNLRLKNTNFTIESIDIKNLIEEEIKLEQPDELPICFKTPLQIRHNDRTIGPGDFDLKTFLKCVYQTLYKNKSLFDFLQLPERVNFMGLIEKLQLKKQNLQWSTKERHSNMSGKLALSGITGNILITGESIQELLPWVQTAKLIGIGKNRVFGNGVFNNHPA